MSQLERRRGEDAFAAIPAGARLPPLWALPLIMLLIGVSLAALMAVAAVLLVVLKLDPTTDWRAAAWLVGGALSLTAALVAVWITYFERRPLATAGIGRLRPAGDAAWFVVGIVFAGVVAMAITSVGEGAAAELGELPRQAAANPGRLFTGAAVVVLVMLTNSAAEELLFRGWALSVIGRRAGLGWAAGVTSVLFGAAHVPPHEWADPARFLSFVSYAFAGLAFAGLALWRRSLWAPIAFHTGFNTLLLTGAYAEAGLDPARLLEKFTTLPLGTKNVDEALVWLTAEVAFAALMIWLWRRSRRISAR